MISLRYLRNTLDNSLMEYIHRLHGFYVASAVWNTNLPNYLPDKIQI